MVKYKYACLSLLVFVISQVLGAFLLFIYSAITGDEDSPMAMSLALMAINVIAIALGFMCKCFNRSTVFNCDGIDWRHGLLMLLPAYLGIFATDMTSELLNITDTMTETFQSISSSWWGILCIAVVGPVAEELVYREGILGNLLRVGVNHRTAIIISSLLFGIVHLNPVQVFVASVIGVILGVLYCRTGNVVLSSILHIINNSIAVALIILQTGDDQSHYYDYITKPGEVALIIVFGIASYYGMRRLYQSYKSTSVPENITC